MRVVPEQVGGELAPQDLAEETLRALAGIGNCGGVPDLARGQLAPVQMGGDHGRAGLTGQVAAGLVSAHGVIEKGADAGLGGLFADLPGGAEAGGPVRPVRQQAPFGEPVGLRQCSAAMRSISGRTMST